MRAGLTITGMLATDDTLFDGVQLPAGVDKQTLIDTIVFSFGDLYLTNTDIEWTKRAITVWGLRHKYYLDELYKTLSYEYNPIENYDRYEEYTDTTNSTETATSENSASNTTNSTTNNNVAAYDAQTLQPDTASTDTGTASAQSAGESQTTSAGTIAHSAHIHGNIGVTTAAQMIEGQRKIINISFYDEAAKLFASEFCIMLY